MNINLNLILDASPLYVSLTEALPGVLNRGTRAFISGEQGNKSNFLQGNKGTNPQFWGNWGTSFIGNILSVKNPALRKKILIVRI